MAISRNIIVGMEEEFFDGVFGKQGTAKDAHDLQDWTVKAEVMLDDTNKTVGDNVHMYLDAYGIFRLTPECFDTKVLFDPLEEELKLPSVAVQKSDIFAIEVEVVGVVGEGSLQFWSIVDDSPEFRRIVASVVLTGKTNRLVSDDIILPLKEVFSKDDLICGMAFRSNDKECARKIDAKEPGKIKVSSVKHIAGQRLICEPVHGIDIVDVNVGDSVENRELGDDVDLGVDSDAGLCRTKLCPSENRHAKVDGRGVDSIESPVKFKLPDDTLLLSNPYHMERKLLEDAIVSNGVCLRECLAVDGRVPKSKKKRLFSMGSSDICEFSQASTAEQLAKHQNKQMVPMRESPFGCSVGVPLNQPFEMAFGQEPCNLHKNVLSCIHICSNNLLAANISISKVRQHFLDINLCA